MYLLKTLLAVLLALVLFSLIVYTYLGVTSTAMWKRLRSTQLVLSLPPPKKYNSPGQGPKQTTTSQTRNDWSKDCIISNGTDGNRSRYNHGAITDSCLKQLDMSEKVSCDFSCQESIQRYRRMSTRLACINKSKSLHPSIWDDKGNLNKNQLERLDHLFPIENSNLIYCSVPKDGCSAWKRILLTVTGEISSPSFQTKNIHPIFREKIKSLASYNVTEALRRLKTYKKFLFVREPMERLLSLFLDKAVRKGDLHFNESQFENFLQFIIDQRLNIIPRHFHEHWTHASHLCLPCDISYDFIGRLETSKRDVQYIFDHFIQKHSDLLMMYQDKHFTNSSDPDKKKRYFQQVSQDILRKVIDKYDLDYVLFNYDKPSLLF